MEREEKKLFVGINDIPYNRVSKRRILTGFSRLDHSIKGLEVGVTLAVGNTNVGKSTLIQGFIKQAIEQNYKTWVFSGEHTAESFLQLLYHQNATHKDYVPIGFKDIQGNDTNIADWYITEEKEEEIRNKFKDNIVIYPNESKRTIDAMLKSMIKAHDDNGFEFFIIDNLISIDNISSNIFAEQTIITEKIRQFALTKKCIVLLVSHQRKISDKGFRIDIQDVAGSQNISNKAYNVIAQYRIDMLNTDTNEYKRLKADVAKNGFDIEQCDGLIEVLKTKGNGNAIVGINYDAETKTYKQANIINKTKADNIIKVIERKPKQITFEDCKDVTDEYDGDLPF